MLGLCSECSRKMKWKLSKYPRSASLCVYVYVTPMGMQVGELAKVLLT